MIREHIAIATDFESWVRADDRFEVVAPRSMNLVCLALRGNDDRDCDDATRSLVEAINASGKAQVTPTVLDGRASLRFCVGSHLTAAARHVEADVGADPARSPEPSLRP